MATSSRSDRVYHQDYIARIRYSNTLPPPPIPPKLLHIPNTGLSSGQYTSSAFASRLAREQPLNIEADAELGMPIDLIGMPGVFEGDESSIQSIPDPPQPHPHDRPLLRPIAALGNKAAAASGVSFLRRTEYISSDQTRQRIDSAAARDPTRQNPKKRKSDEFERDNDPSRILQSILRSFDLAYPEDAQSDSRALDDGIRGAQVSSEDRIAWNNPKHPIKPMEVEVVDSYPILPDLEAFPDSGSYFVMNFNKIPTNTGNQYDGRLDVGLLRPLELSPEAQAQITAKRKAHELDPSQPPPGPPQFDYEFFLPQGNEITKSIKAKFDVKNPNKDNEDLYDGENKDGKRFFKFKRLRQYETYQQFGEGDDVYGQQVALALHEPSTEDEQANSRSAKQKAAYIYPILQRSTVRPKRAAGLGLQNAYQRRTEQDGNKIDYLEVAIREPDDSEKVTREAHSAQYEGIAMPV